MTNKAKPSLSPKEKKFLKSLLESFILVDQEWKDGSIIKGSLSGFFVTDGGIKGVIEKLKTLTEKKR